MSVKRIKTEQEWLDARKQVITATEAASILGLNPWSGPAKMWTEKHNRTFTGNACTKLGELLEPMVVQVGNQLLNENFQVIEDDTGKLFYVNDKLKLGATPDADNGVMFYEAKSTKPLNFLKYRGLPPTQYIMQTQVQMICGDRDKAYLAILGTDLTQDYRDEDMKLPFCVFEVKRCPKLEQLLTKELKNFWTKVKNGSTIRVNSQVKKEANLLIHLTYKRII